MSFDTDSIFISALRVKSGDTSVSEDVGGRLYGCAIPLPDEDLRNVALPYVVVTFDGLSNEGQSKDEPWESGWDTVTIGVEVCSGTLSGLHALLVKVRQSVSDYVIGHAGEAGVPVEMLTRCGAMNYDSVKPCYWARLSYQCEVLSGLTI